MRLDRYDSDPDVMLFHVLPYLTQLQGFSHSEISHVRSAVGRIGVARLSRAVKCIVHLFVRVDRTRCASTDMTPTPT